MGLDKLSLKLEGKALHEIPAEALRECCGSFLQVGRDLGLPDFSIVPDVLPGEGPLVGLLSALEECETPWLLAVAGDMPAVTLEVLAWIQDSAESGKGQAWIPLLDSRMEPLCAAYSKSLAPNMRKSIHAGERSIQKFLQASKSKIDFLPVPLKMKPQFLNLNRPQDWEEFTGIPLPSKS
jgi:molybdopterin-guanine dinucleotide biosynthesis protein A